MLLITIDKLGFLTIIILIMFGINCYNIDINLNIRHINRAKVTVLHVFKHSLTLDCRAPPCSIEFLLCLQHQSTQVGRGRCPAHRSDRHWVRPISASRENPNESYWLLTSLTTTNLCGPLTASARNWQVREGIS